MIIALKSAIFLTYDTNHYWHYCGVLAARAAGISMIIVQMLIWSRVTCLG